MLVRKSRRWAVSDNGTNGLITDGVEGNEIKSLCSGDHSQHQAGERNDGNEEALQGSLW